MYCDKNQVKWDVALPHITFAFNTAKQDTMKISQYELLFGCQPKLFSDHALQFNPNTDFGKEIKLSMADAQKMAADNIKKKQLESKERYDVKRRHVEFFPGQKVRIYTPSRVKGKSPKLMSRWFGPFVITRKFSDVNYEVQKGTGAKSRKDTVNVEKMKLAYD
jgi:hypothetical protein